MRSDDRVDSRRIRVSLGLLLCALAVLLAQAGVLIHLGAQVRRYTEREARVGTALYHLREVLGDLLDAETSYRGFLLSGRDEFLVPYERSVRDVEAHVRRVRDSLGGGPHYESRLAAIETWKQRKLSGVAEGIRLARAGHPREAIARVRGGEGKYHMEQVRGAIDALMGELRVERDAATRRLGKVAGAIDLILSIGAVALTVLVGGAVANLLAVIRGQGRRHRLLHEEATIDRLTGLPNRRALQGEFERLLARAQRGEAGLAVLFIDLDGFKQINDELGHLAGDAVLASVSARLRGVMRGSDFLARMGGDEFVVLVSGEPGRASAETLARRIREVVGAPMDGSVFGGRCVGASVGVAWYPDQGTTVAALLRAADAAMYGVKRRGRPPAGDRVPA